MSKSSPFQRTSHHHHGSKSGGVGGGGGVDCIDRWLSMLILSGNQQCRTARQPAGNRAPPPSAYENRTGRREDASSSSLHGYVQSKASSYGRVSSRARSSSWVPCGFWYRARRRKSVLTEDSIASRHGAGAPELSSSDRDRSYVPSTAGSRSPPPPPLAFDIPTGYTKYGSQAPFGAGSSRNTQAPQTGRSPSSLDNHKMTSLASQRYRSHLFPFIRIMTISNDVIVTTEHLLRWLWWLPQAEQRTNLAIRRALPLKPAIG